MSNFVEIGQTAAKIRRFLKMAAAAILDFQNVGHLGGANGSRRPKCVTMPNFVSIGQTVAEIWPFFDFSRRRPQPYWIFKI